MCAYSKKKAGFCCVRQRTSEDCDLAVPVWGQIKGVVRKWFVVRGAQSSCCKVFTENIKKNMVRAARNRALDFCQKRNLFSCNSGFLRV